MITIKEIADIVGVSTTTVSNVIHGKTKKVSSDNIERIQKVIREKKYIPRMGLSSLTNKQSHIIGVVIHITKEYENTILSDPFYGQIVGYLETYIREAGYYMMLYTSKDLNDIFKMAAAWNVDGLVAITFTYNNYQKIRSLTEKPIVAIDLYNESDDDYINVGLDDEGGGYQMTRYLIENGFEKILLLASQDIGVDHHRFIGYQRALKEYDIPYNEKYYIRLGNDPQKRASKFNDLLKYTKKNYAMFFLSDLLAVEGMRYFIDHGVSIPNDLSIAGFDDNLYAQLLSPQLSSVHQDVSLKAKITIETLMKIINDEPLEQTHISLPVHLAIRGTIKTISRSQPNRSELDKSKKNL
ncbi:LacI family DNA-binding transcriptional regulator [Fusibacter ferrireducens]|uniref:LacI family DNA-binding transcriptional regulator n=1 Tax=Fusibacter ferrireducens TaxID=2785058 RepID=A0ABR9ZPZ5_9FIRM|nr:LacI family DNA-binding transcriptional regulator [Fusibacter ferrireducens]MBF4692533.1 LacI family DNA-binding transcriptional regulator [Fusibacter ferrireducens]